MFGRRQKKHAKSGQTTAAAAKTKENLLEKLVESVKELQQEYKDRDKKLELNELTSQLCSVLEAMFLHGLKATFLGRLSSRLGSEFSPRMPEPSFWTFALVFSHKQVITTVEKYSQISTEVGRCRAWLRLALNDSLMVSYLAAMGEDRVSLSVHYENYAFLRDPEKLDVASRYLAGVELYTFNLATNVSMLNRWLPEPLSLAGIWNTPLLSTAIDMAAVDAAAAVVEDSTSPVATPTAGGTHIRSLAQPVQSSTNSLYQLGLMNEDEALRLILGATPVSLPPSPLPPPSSEEEEQPDASFLFSPIVSRSPSPRPIAAVHLEISASVSTGDDIQAPVQLTAVVNEDLDVEVPTGDLSPPLSSASASSRQSLEWEPELPPPPVALLVRSKEGGVADAAPVSLHEELLTADLQAKSSPKSSDESKDSSCWCSSLGPAPGCVVCQEARQLAPPQLSEEVRRLLGPPAPADLITLESESRKRKAASKIGFRERPVLVLPEFSLKKTIELTACLDLLPREAGIDAQDWRCVDCTKAIGAIFGPGKVCSFTRRYYCTDCHQDDPCVIPGRLLYSWDGRPQPCARSSQQFLLAVRPRPIFHLRTFNVSLVKFVPQVEAANRRRKELSYLSSYVAACSRAASLAIKHKMDELLDNRDYLYSETELYSLLDLEQLYRGELLPTLARVVDLCTAHVESCLICGGRGFICEVCQDRRPVYPFHLDSTSQCQACCTVFHYECSLSLSECPKCERIAARSLDRLVVQSRLARELAEP